MANRIERTVEEAVRKNPDVSIDELLIKFPGETVWNLRTARRDALLQVADKEQVIADIDPRHSVPTPTAAAAIQAGFFRPLRVEIPERRQYKPTFTRAGHTYLCLSDIHAGDEDPHAVDVAVQVGQAVGVDELILNGDIFDVHALSRYTPAREKPLRWVEERERALPVVAEIRGAFPKIPAHFIYGNHDIRPEKFIAQTAPQLQGLITLPEILGIEGLDFTFAESNRHIIADKLLVMHGTRVRKDAGASVKEEVRESGMSVVMGHVHRRALYELSNTAQEIRGDQPLIGVELGCLCSLRPSYLEPEKTANWQHGAAIITVYSRGLVDVEPIRIHRGAAFFRGRMFTSRVGA